MSRNRVALFLSALALTFCAAAAKPVFSDAGSLRDDMNFLASPQSDSSVTQNEIRKPPSDAKAVLLGLIWFYQVFISSQDGDNCGFTLSCSHFGQAALKEYGIVEGVLMTSDRLQRCNGIGMDYYPSDPLTGRAIDPVSSDALWR